jgi:hypothetical protein
MPVMSVLDDAVKLVNFITARPTNSRIFIAVYKEMGSMPNCVLPRTEVRWLSNGKILVHLSELENVFVFMTHPFHRVSCMQNPVWLQTSAYLAENFSLSLHGSNTTVFYKQNKLNHS